MLTLNDIKLIEKSFDKKLQPIKVDIDTIQARVSDMETGYASKLDYLEIRSILNRVEKRMAAQETRLTKIETSMVTKDDTKTFATKDDLKKALRGVARKRDLNLMEKRIIRKINLVSDSHDSRLIDLEKQINLPPINN